MVTATKAGEDRALASNSAIQSVQRALGLLRLFAPSRTRPIPQRREWSVTELAKESGLHKSVVARLMATMAHEGFVIQNPTTRRYSIGPLSFAVGSSYEPLRVLDQIARPSMEALTEACGHASYIGVPAGRHYVFLLAVESTRSVRVTIDVGENRAYHSGAIGKILLADLSDDEVVELTGTGPFPQLTPKTIVSPSGLLKELAEVRQTGVAFNREESILGASSIAVAIRDSNERAVSGLAIVFPSHIVDDDEITRLIPLVQATGREISHRLGALYPDSFERIST